MTNEELARQMGLLAEVQTETLRLIGRESERRDLEISELRQAQIATERSLARLSDEVSELRQGQVELRQAQIELRQAQIATERSLARLSESVDRFIQRGGNGQ